MPRKSNAQLEVESAHRNLGLKTMLYSNPRFEATIADWPSGRHRTTATFTVETSPGRGQRVRRITVDPKTDKPCAPKTTTYARQARIVDGDDGRTYIAELTMYGFISIMRGDMAISQEAVFEHEPGYAALRALFDAPVTP